MSSARVQPGQTWRRKKDGVLTVVESVGGSWDIRATVMHRTTRTVHTETRNFLRKYELVEEVAS